MAAPRTTLILSDVDCLRYPQPVYLARAVARGLGECHLLDPFGLHHFTPSGESEIRPRPVQHTPGMFAGLWARFLFAAARLRPRALIAINETNLAPLRLASSFLGGRTRFGAYFLDYWEDPLAPQTRRLAMGHRTLASRAPWLDFVIDCAQERLERRAWIDPARHATFILHNSPPREAAPPPVRPAPGGPMQIVYTGRNDPNVCLENFFEAFAQFAQPSELHLYLTGHERRTARLREAVAKLGLGGRVHFHAPVPKEELVRIFSESDAGLALYPYDETTNLNDVLCAPNKAFEYLAAGLALIVSANPTLEFIGREELGVCVNPRDPDSILEGLNRLAANHAHAEMGRRARAHHESALSYEREVAPIIAHLAGPAEA